MTTTSETETDAGDGFYEAHHIGLIHMVDEARKREKAAKADAEMPAQILKSYLQESDEKKLVDEERGLYALLQERSGTEWDLRAVPVRALMELQSLGLLKVDNAAFDALRKTAPSSLLDIAARFRRQTIGSVALIIGKLE